MNTKIKSKTPQKMAPMSILTHPHPPKSFNKQPLKFNTATPSIPHKRPALPLPSHPTIKLPLSGFLDDKPIPLLRIRTFAHEDAGNFETDREENGNSSAAAAANEIFRNQKHHNNNNNKNDSFLIVLGIGVGIAAIVTIISVVLNKPIASCSNVRSFFGVQCLAETSSSAPVVGFSFKAFGYRIVLPEYATGYLYFWLLMAAGCGLFISEEALNVWVGVSLSRLLTVDGTWQTFVESFSRNAPYIISTILWVYWGVCISDMIPFYLGKLFRESGATDNICSKLGIGEEKVLSITRVVQKYGNLAGVGEL